jgi:Cu(I)/Ag(I) efflux system protein CusF
MNAISKLALATVIALSSATLAFGQEAHHGAHGSEAGHDVHNASTSTQSNGVAGQMVDGEIRKVDKEAGKITIRHGELKDLGMPAMTMVFRAKDPGMLDQVKAGDKVKFVAEKVGGAFMLVKLENVQ